MENLNQEEGRDVGFLKKNLDCSLPLRDEFILYHTPNLTIIVLLGLHQFKVALASVSAVKNTLIACGLAIYRKIGVVFITVSAYGIVSRMSFRLEVAFCS